LRPAGQGQYGHLLGGTHSEAARTCPFDAHRLYRSRPEQVFGSLADRDAVPLARDPIYRAFTRAGKGSRVPQFKAPTKVFQAPVGSFDRSCIDEDRVRLRRSATSRDLACIKLNPLAHELDTSPWTILRWVRQKRFPAPFQMTPTGPLLWKKSDVAAHIEKCKRSRRQVRRGGQLKQFIKQKGDE